MKENFDSLLGKIEETLPNLITPEMLLKLGLANHVQLFRIRQSGTVPFLKLSSARIVYLKKDIISWLKHSYNEAKSLEECVNVKA